MVRRAAFFAKKHDIETYFKLQTYRENLFEPHYNISPGHSIAVVTPGSGRPELQRVRWGKYPSGKPSFSTLSAGQAVEDLSGKNTVRCVVPLSGFYIWKENREKDHPFFVRMLNKPFMAVAGILYGGKEEYFRLIESESNALVQPMTDQMPLMLNHKLAMKWLSADADAAEIVNEAKNLFLLTDISVTRVQKKVNDPTNNDPTLVQPVPK